MAGVSVDVTIDPRDLARVTRRLEQWQGQPLMVRMSKVMAAAARLMVKGLQVFTPHRTGGLRASERTRRFVSQGSVGYRIWPTKRVPDKGRSDLLAALLVHGTKRGVSPDPFVDEAQRAFEPQLVGFIAEQIRRLA